MTEDQEEETFVDVTLVAGKCTKQSVISVEKTVKFLLDQVEISQSFVVIVLNEKMVAVKKVQGDLVLENEIIPINSY